MSPVIARLRSELRAHWRAWAGVVLLIGFGGGVVLTTLAGARRTATAYDRFLRASHAADLLVSPDNTGFPDLYAKLARATHADVTPVIGFGAAPISDPERPVLIADLFETDALVRQVVVGIDGLPEASDAAAWATRHCGDAHFLAVHALELAPAFLHLGDEPEAQQLYDLALTRATERLRDHWCRPFTDAGVSFESVVEEGGPVDVLLAAVTRTVADLVVVSRRDHHLRRGTLGGVGHRILAYAPCAAAMVPSAS